MPEDKAPDSSPQGADQPQNLTEALFGQHISQCWVTQAASGDAASWQGHFYKRDRVEAFDPMRGHYFSIALMKPGAKTRSDAEFAGGILIVADDVGHVTPDGVSALTPGAEVDIHDFEMFAPETSYENETSHGNFQMGWRISPIEPNLARWKHFIEQMKKHPIFGKAFTKCTAVHYVRMETGSNQPKVVNKVVRPRFKTKLRKPYTGLTYTLDELADAFGIDMTLPSGASVPPRQRAMGEQIDIAKVRKLLELLPNDKAEKDGGYGYLAWIGIGMAVYGATNGSQEGFEAFEEWSRQSPIYGVMPAEVPETKWPTFAGGGASATTLRVLVEKKYGVDSPERKAVSQMFASEIPGLDVIADEAGIDATEKAQAEKDFMALIREARTLAKIPDKFRRESDDPNWLNDENFEDAFSLAAVVQPASPTVFAPFDRGVLSVRSGAPFSGKSLLILDQSAAFVCERPDLLGHGFGPDAIQFAGDVLYFCNEDSRSVAVRRLQAWKARHGDPVAKHKLLLVKSTLMSRRDGKPPIIECLRVLRVAVEHLRQGHSLPLIVFDTIRASVSGVDENSAEETAEVLGLMKLIAWGFWASVVFIHHGTKVAWKGGEPMLDTALSGSGNFAGTVRGADVVRAITGKERADKGWGALKVVGVTTIKASDDDMAGERYYSIETVQVQAEHAAEDGVMVSKGMPVAVPLLPMVAVSGAFVDEEEQAELLDELMEALDDGPVWRYSRSPRKGPPSGVAVHELWNMDRQKASQIVDKLVETGVIRVVPTKVARTQSLDRIEAIQDSAG